MNEFEFKKWLDTDGTPKKIQSDLISRIKRVEREIDHCDIDYEYHNDQCEKLLSYFEKNGHNERMARLKNCNLPIGKYSMSTFRYAIKKYKQFMIEVN